MKKTFFLLILPAAMGIAMKAQAQNWLTTGNAGTTSANFIGTTDNAPLRFKIRNLNAGLIDSSSHNTAFGYRALEPGNGGGTGNSAFGYNALLKTLTDGTGLGVYNTAIGTNALRSNFGFANTANGYIALYSNTSGEVNTANGAYALYYNTTGSYNTANGVDALYYNTTGSYNTANGNRALYSTTTSQYNTAVGYDAGDSYNNGYNNVFVGANTDVNGTGYYNVIAIGQATVVGGSSIARFGNSATGSYGGWAGWSNVSDGRFKNNVKENVPGLSFINKLKPVTYHLAATALDEFYHRNNKDSIDKKAEELYTKALKEKEQITYTGFVAQDVEAAAKELGFDFSGIDKPKNDNDTYGLRYAEFTVPLVKAVQELSAKNEQLEARIEKLEALLKLSIGNISLTDASLQQNTPNPVRTSTTIPYTLPSKFSTANIVITDATGKLLKTSPVNGAGRGTLNIDISKIPSGSYNYTLYVDKQVVGTKQLVIAR